MISHGRRYGSGAILRIEEFTKSKGSQRTFPSRCWLLRRFIRLVGTPRLERLPECSANDFKQIYEKYGTPEKSPLKIEVKKAMTNLEIKLD